MIAERYKFYNTNQDSIEDIKSIAARLKKLTQYLQLWSVSGLRSATIVSKLLPQDNITFVTAYEIAV